MKIDILAVGIHPDDVELSAGGTLLLQASLGHRFGMLDLSRGELGTRGSAEQRREEALAAAHILGAAFRQQLEVPDGFFVYHPDNWLPIVRVIRECRPEVVLCNAPDDRHPDHARAARMTVDACFYSGLRKIHTTDDDGASQDPWRPKCVYHYIQDKQLEPDFTVDITPFFSKKMEAIRAFKSQFYDPESPDPPTPISGQDFLFFMESKNRVFGRPSQADFAEGFICTRTPGVRSLMDLY